MADNKMLKIQHDGEITVSTFSPLMLGETPLHKIIAQELGLAEMDYKHYQAYVTVTVEFKNTAPIAYWEEKK